MTDITWMKQRVPCSVILGVEDDSELEPMSGGGAEPKRTELSELAADLTWKLCKETTVTREELPDGAMVEIVRQLLK